MINNPENQLVTMTAKGIEQMIGRAVGPLANENRKLKFLLGLSLGDAIEDNDPPQTVDQMLDVLHAIANNHPSWKNPQIPSDLLITAGVQAMKSHLATVKAMVEGDRPRDRDDLDFKETMKNAITVLTDLFCDEFSEDWYRKNEKRYQPVELLPDHFNGDETALVLWQIRLQLNSRRAVFYSDEPFQLRPKERNQ